MERHSLAEFLEDFQQQGREVAYVQRRGYRMVRWTYRQVAETAFRFARELNARGISKGDRLLIWGPNSAEWVAVWFGCVLRGVILVPIDDIAMPDFVLRVSQQVNPKLILCSRQHARTAIPMPALVLEELSETLAPRSSAPCPAVAIDPRDPLEIVFTSGTTADPKGVVISHGNVLSNIAPLEGEIRKYRKYERLAHPLRFMNLLPLSHIFGQFMGIFLPPLMAGTVIFQDSLKPADVIAAIRRERVSVLAAVPRVLQSLQEKIERDFAEEGRSEKFRRQFTAAEGKHFLRRWWIFRQVHRKLGWKFWAFISGGAALDRETEEFWGRLGYAVIQGYGLTETTSLVSVNHPFHLGRGSIGKVLPGRELKLGPDGEILVRGSGVATGYWSGQELQPVSSEEGWYPTGDIGELDADGNLYFKGRKKDVIVTPGGMNIYPVDLETALRRQPEVKDCVIVPLPRNANAEPFAVVILRDRGVELRAVVERANESLAEYQRMRAWLVWPEEDFPRTSTQKPKTAWIQHAVQSGLVKTGLQELPSSPLAELIGRIAGRGGNSGAGASLDGELNLSSLDRVELLSALEDRYQVDLSETAFASVSTVAGIEKMLQGRIPPRVPYHYPRWAQRWPVTWVRWLVHYLLLRPSVFLLGWPRVTGRENLGTTPAPVLVICNHIGDVDVGFVLTALPAHIRHKLATATGGEALEVLRTSPSSRSFIGKIYDRLKWMLGVSLLNLFPLPREAGFRHSFEYAAECVDRGYSILVFPEGRHTTDGKMLPFRSGIGLLAGNLAIPVVPIRIDGLFEVMQAGKRFVRPYTVQIKIGKPVSFPPGIDPAGIATELQKIVEAL